MTAEDIRLLSPEIALVGLGIIIVLLDLVVPNKKLLTLVALSGLVGVFVLAVLLWIDLGSVPSGELKGIFNTLTVDYYAVYFKFILLILTFLVITLSSAYMQRIHRNQGEYLGLVLFSSTGMMLLPAAGDLVTLYLSLELTALPIAALAAFLRTPKSSEAAIKFFILNAISSALLLYGMALIYGLTGTTYLTEISSLLSR